MILRCIADRCYRCAQAASDVYAPVSGEVVEANQALVEDPAKVRV